MRETSQSLWKTCSYAVVSTVQFFLIFRWNLLSISFCLLPLVLSISLHVFQEVCNLLYLLTGQEEHWREHFHHCSDSLLFVSSLLCFQLALCSLSISAFGFNISACVVAEALGMVCHVLLPSAVNKGYICVLYCKCCFKMGREEKTSNETVEAILCNSNITVKD